MIIKKPTEIDYEHIDLILREADAYNLRTEVETLASKIINNNLAIDVVEAYKMAYNQIIK